MATDADLGTVLSYYALNRPAVRQIEPLAGGGWSGSRIWRLTAAGGEALCLRRWPAEHPPAPRLRLIHDVLLGVAAAGKLTRDAAAFTVEWIDSDLHALGMQALERARKRHLSLVDHVSFLVMRRHRIETAFAFDPDFVSAGFRLVAG